LSIKLIRRTSGYETRSTTIFHDNQIYDDDDEAATAEANFPIKKHRLTVLAPAHGNGTFTKDLSLHVDSVLAHQTVTTQATSDNAGAGSLAVVFRVCGI
jgi:hypothetical protein